MATRRIRINLPIDLALLCRRAGEQMVEDFANPQTYGDALSATLSTHGAETNPFLLADARAAEAVFCSWIGLDPIPVITRRHADEGWDVKFYSVAIDIKHTQHPRGQLIWPLGKTHLFDEKPFDLFVLVVGASQTFELCGWMTKTEFKAKHKTADHNLNLRLTPGTWYVPQEQLREMDELPAAIEWMADNDPNVVLRSA